MKVFFVCVMYVLALGLSFQTPQHSTFFGNELAQFEKYLYLTASVNASDLYEQYNLCEKNTIPEKGHRYYNCRHDIRKAQQDKRAALWNHGQDVGRDGKKYPVNCQYSVSGFTSKIVKGSSTPNSGNAESYNLFSFDIKQSSCAVPMNVPAAGGSTFEIFARSDDHLAHCRTIDNFDNSYRVDCKSPLLVHGQPSSSSSSSSSPPSSAVAAAVTQCLHITVLVQFEHFDAFSDLGESDWSSLAHTVFDGQSCVEGAVADDPSKFVYGGGDSFWTRPLSHLPHLITPSDAPPAAVTTTTTTTTTTASPSHSQGGRSRRARGHHTVPEYPYSSDFQWRSEGNKYLRISAMKRCLKHQTIFFVGESHMRYQFDITMDRYVDRLRVGRYHGNMNVSGISYADMTFSARMAAFIDTLGCHSEGARVTYVLQTGSWDLQFFPPRGFISSPYQGRAVVQALKKFFDRTASCKSTVAIIYMSTMPHPWCKAADSHCIRLMNYWRNNGAILASNQFIEQELRKLNADNLYIIDTPSIIQPRFYLEEFVCVDHFMCNNPPRGLVTTPAGMALANEVLITACEAFFTPPEEPTSSAAAAGAADAGGQGTSAVVVAVNPLAAAAMKEAAARTGARLDVNGPRQIVSAVSFHDGERYVGAPSQRTYTVEQGCRQEIPDRDTLLYMGMSIDSFTTVPDSFLLDIPTCHRTAYPSRKTGTLLQTFSTRSVYFMDQGKKRQINGAHVLFEFGLTFDNVTFILEEDFDVIPKGDILMSKADCKSC